MILTIYLVGIVFDLILLVGTAWLVEYREWSPWWFVFSLMVCMSEFQGAKKLLGIPL